MRTNKFGKAKISINGQVIGIAESGELSMELEEEFRVPRQMSFSIESATWHRPTLSTPKLNRHFKEVRVPWDVSKAKKKLKRG
jgi:hypothetical protein